MKKNIYETPEAELFVVRIERNILSQVINNSNAPYFDDEAVIEDGTSDIFW